MGRFRARIVVIGVALFGVVAAVWLLYPRGTSLFDRATRVAADADYNPGGFYWWLSNHQVVLTHRVNGSLSSLFCHDTNTGKDDPCVSLNRMIRTQKSAARIEALSPDRRVLLFRSWEDRQVGATQDGRILFTDRQTASTPKTEPASESDMADGFRWVEPIYAWPSQERLVGAYHIARLLIRDGTRHTVVKTVTVSPWLEQGFPETITTRNHWLMQKRTGSIAGPISSIQTIDIDLNADAPKPQTLTLNLSPGSHPFFDLCDVCYSPDGERVAFVRVLDNRSNVWLPPFLEGWRDRLFPRNKTMPYKISLWVSDLRGQQMHEVGSVPHGNDFNPGNRENPNYAQWLPDGKTLSFLAKGAVWTVSAD